ncbi:MAG: M20/M25/M40 family metallo-hydrolase [Acidobacteria bacterium]|nr:M20/M25/M40 family metallo-hydrolase [Acidobacteriota bacterium]MCA1612101.1 M20/M25/M40 family metallo-hydrolase [Acidobacteriota bacterium]
MRAAGVTTVLDRLIEFVSIQSVSGNEGPLADRIAGICADFGMRAEREGRNVVARRGTGSPCLLLNSHLDTVPAVDGWTGDPWAPRVEGDRLVGLGASDAKASVAALLEAFLTAPLPERGSLLFAATCDEETGGQGLETIAPNLDFDAAIVGEPNRFSPAIAQKGLVKVKLIARGRAGHAARPHLADNAIVRAAEDVAAIAAMRFDAEDPYLGKPTATATVIRGGLRSNIVPDVCEVTVDARTIGAFDNDAMVAAIRAAVKSDFEILSVRLRPVAGDPSWKIAQAASAAAGGAPITGFPSVSDLAHLGGRPAIVFGPGEPSHSHAADESISIAAILEAPDVYRRTISAYFA